MNGGIGPYHVIDFPPERRAVLSFIDVHWRKHCMYGLLEVDVTVARQFIEEHKARSGEQLSFTGYVAFCLARAVDEDKTVQACMKGRGQLVVFDDVNIGLTVEQTIGERRILKGHVIRGANHKTYREIHEEIRAAQSKPLPPRKEMDRRIRFAMSLPWPVLRLFNALLRMTTRRDPTMFPSRFGTVGITAVGMFGKGLGGWGIAPTAHALELVVGSTAWKPAVVEGRIEPREILNLTVVFDHDVIDGAPATRFTQRLVELIESGYGLGEDQAKTAIDTEPADISSGLLGKSSQIKPQYRKRGRVAVPET
jgi:hypothetical protein